MKGAAGEAGMVSFTGTVDCPNFHGVILPGGVDTQRMVDGHLTLSARYMLEGTDADGNACRVFIENNGATDDPAQPMTTTPVIFTDSPALQWLETAALRGTWSLTAPMASSFTSSQSEPAGHRPPALQALLWRSTPGPPPLCGGGPGVTVIKLC